MKHDLKDLKLKKFPDPFLLKKMEKVETFLNLTEVKTALLQAMKIYHGVGLAANQVGLNLNAFVMSCEGAENPQFSGEIMICNPQIIQVEGVSDQEEGCLSLPAVRYNLGRAKRILLKWQNEYGDHLEGWFGGLASVCIQHEMDHLNGKLMLDHLSPLKKQMAIKKMQKYEKQKN